MKQQIIDIGKKYNVKFEYNDKIDERANLKSLVHLLFLTNEGNLKYGNYYYTNIDGRLSDEQVTDIKNLGESLYQTRGL